MTSVASWVQKKMTEKKGGWDGDGTWRIIPGFVSNHGDGKSPIPGVLRLPNGHENGS